MKLISNHSMKDKGKARFEPKEELSDVNLSDGENEDDSIPDVSHFIHSGVLRSPKQAYAAYIVFRGRRLGIFTSWTSAAESIRGVCNARYAGYTLQEAILQWNTQLREDHTLLDAARRQLEQDRLDSFLSSCPQPSTPVRKSKSQTTLPNTPSSSRATPSSSRAGHGDNCYYVVQAGIRPGVYKGSFESWEAAGPSPNAIRFPTESEMSAWKIFGLLVMEEQVHWL
ncbi:hypothetical protein BJ165DRAFT_1411380 [Panaeolus papilionaceus]|nr:hypothetical protein BJ165DRAFT_1411380 [Panaeolus papilionaceus]